MAAGRDVTLSECIALAKAYEDRLGQAPLPDDDFATDVENGIADRNDAFQPPVWE